MIFTDWFSGSVAEHPARATVEPAVMRYVPTDAETIGTGDEAYIQPTELGEVWNDPFTGLDEVPTASSSADRVFDEEWPGTDVTRGWLPYWTQLTNNLNVFLLRTSLFFDWYGPYRYGGGTPEFVGYYLRSKYDRDMTQEVRVMDDVLAIHPAFALAPPGYDLIQFEDEEEPAPITDGQTGRGRPTAFTGYRIHVYAENTTVDGWPGPESGPYEWGVDYTIRHRSSPEASDGGWVQRYLPDGGGEEYGVIHDGDGEWDGTGAPPSPGEWENLISESSTTLTDDASITLDPDSAGFCPHVLIAARMSNLAIPEDAEMPPDPDIFNSAEVTRMLFYATVQWPSYRYARSSEGMWNVRQRQTLGGNSGGWPTRQRQNGGATGAYSVRQRQTGL